MSQDIVALEAEVKLLDPFVSFHVNPFATSAVNKNKSPFAKDDFVRQFQLQIKEWIVSFNFISLP